MSLKQIVKGVLIFLIQWHESPESDYPLEWMAQSVGFRVSGMLAVVEVPYGSAQITFFECVDLSDGVNH